MESKTTIYDIAARLNITAATVSRALNDNPRISKATKKLVLETAKEMNYQTNRLAVALKQGKSNNVGVVVPYINRNFFSSIIRGVEEELYPEGFNVIICQTHDNEKREIEIINNLLKSQVAGILVSMARFTKSDVHFNKVIRSNTPLIFFDRIAENISTSSVTIDDFKGSYEATQHLIDQGKKRIAHLTVDLSVKIYKERLAGYKAALQDANIPFDDELVMSLLSDIEEGKKAAFKLMDLEFPPDAIYSASDHGALGAINWLKSQGYKIPEEISVVGFGNEPFTQFMELSISSTDQKPLEMGKNAAQILLRQVKGSKKEIENIVLEPKFIQRASSAL